MKKSQVQKFVKMVTDVAIVILACAVWYTSVVYFVPRAKDATEAWIVIAFAFFVTAGPLLSVYGRYLRDRRDYHAERTARYSGPGGIEQREAHEAAISRIVIAERLCNLLTLVSFVGLIAYKVTFLK